MTDTTLAESNGATNGKFPPETFGYRELSPKVLVANEANPRKQIDTGGDEFKALVASIVERGIIEPLVVFPRSKAKFELIAGHRRLLAAVAAKLDVVPVVVRPEPSKADQLVDMLVENGHRADLTPVEEAIAFQGLVDAGWKQAEIAKQAGYKPPHVTKRLSLLKLPEVALGAVEAGAIPLDKAHTLSKIKDPRTVRDLVRLGAPSDYALERALDAQKRADAAEKAAKDLEAAGAAIIDLRQVRNGTAALLADDDLRTSLELGKVHVVAVDAATHAGEPCHGVVVFPGLEAGKQTLAACSDPTSHADAAVAKFDANSYSSLSSGSVQRRLQDAAQRAKADTAAREPSADEVASRERFERFAAAAALRRGAVATLVQSPRQSHHQLVELAAAAGVLWNASADAARIACELLGVEPLNGYRGAHEAIDMLVVGGGRNAACAAAACASARFEAVLFCPAKATWDELAPYQRTEARWHSIRDYGWWAKQYLTWLASVGVMADDESTSAAEAAIAENALAAVDDGEVEGDE